MLPGVFFAGFVRNYCLYTTTTISCSIWSMSTTSQTSKQRVTVFLNPALLKHARAKAIVEEVTLTTLVENALINYLPVVTAIKKIEL